MMLSNVICIIVTIVSTYCATNYQHIRSTGITFNEIPEAHPLDKNVNLSVDVRMSVGEEKHKVHKLLFSVPTQVLYEAVLTVLTPIQAVKLRNDIRRATDSVAQKIRDVGTDEVIEESYLSPRKEKDDPHSSPFYQSDSMIENENLNGLKHVNKGSLAIYETRKESHIASLQSSHSQLSNAQILTKDEEKNMIHFLTAPKKKHVKVPKHSITEASSAIRTKFKTLFSTFEEPLRSRLLSSSEFETVAVTELTQAPTDVCQVLDIEIKTDDYGSETTWVLKNDATDEVILSGGPYENDVINVNKHKTCLFPRLYSFAIFDSFGDGIEGDGYYKLKLNGVTIRTGGQFEIKDVVPINVTLPSEAISNKPSVSFHPTVRPSPTVTPSMSSHPSSEPSLSFKPTMTSLPTLYCNGEGEVQGQVIISARNATEKIVWSIFQSKSDEALFEGGLGITDICVSAYKCYTFRIHEGIQDNIFDYKLVLGGLIEQENYEIDRNHDYRFGLRSCCKTTCCPANQASLTMFLYSNGQTDDLSWKLYQSQSNTMSTNTLIMQGGQYDGNQDSYSVETCIDPMICHTLEIFGENKTASYNSIVVKINDETKSREYDVQSGSTIEFCSICSTKPLLVKNYGGNVASDDNRRGTVITTLRRELILQTLSQVSSHEQLLDVKTAQYKAACWIIFDDLLHLQSNNPLLVQRYALAVLYHTTDGDNWRLSDFHSKFLSNDNECDWIENEIKCGDDGQIYDMNLAKMNMKGRIPTEIASLRSLKSLNLGSNYLEGNIPEELGILKGLRRLELYSNTFTGAIPDSIFDLSELQTLNLMDNLLTGTLSTLVGKLYQLEYLQLRVQYLTGIIPEELFGVLSLKYIDLAYNTFTGTISSLIGRLSALEKIDLSVNMLRGMIPATIGQVQDLRKVWFDFNSLTGSIPSEMGQLENLELVWLQGNQLQGTIPEEMTKMRSLTELSLYDNLLEGTISPNIANMTSLKQVLLNGNNFHGTIPSSISKLNDLELLQLHSNSLEGTVSKEICELQDTKRMQLGADCAYEYTPPKVECECCSYCEKQFSRMDKCRESELRIKISYKDLNWFGKYWSIYNGVNQTVISNNYGYDVETPPKSSYSACIAISDCFRFVIDGSFESFPHLSFSIFVNDNKIYDNDDNKHQIWRGKVNFGYSDSLKTSALDQCDNIWYNNKTYAIGSQENLVINQIATISGYSSILDERSAEYQAVKWILHDDEYTYDASNTFRIIQRYILALLYFSTNGENWHNKTNYITGNNECEWAGVICDGQSVLEGLNLNGNNLIGSIPHGIGHLSMLKYLDLSDNKGLYGSLSDEIGNLWSLQTLDFSNCGISGSIPDKIWLLDNLHSLKICCNEITGSLPKRINKAKRIEYLDLHENKMYGSLPMFSNGTILRELDLSSNFFEGSLLNLGFELQMDHLEKLNLSRNVLNSDIPSLISRFRSLKELDLSRNGLTGSIPSALDNIEGLETLVLNGNKLTGVIPFEIYRIQGLKKVLIQNNKLTGTISSQIGELKYLEEVSLSYNSLKGLLPEEITNIKENLTLLHVHFNDLTGRTSWMTDCNVWNDRRSFISDCGAPSISSSPMGCKCCTICCNSDGFCRENESSNFTPLQGVLISCATILAFLILCAFVTKYLKKYKKLPFLKLDLVKTISDDSIYYFFLTNDKICMVLTLLVLLCQFFTYLSFLMAASYRTEDIVAFQKFQSAMDDWIYSMRCPPNALTCTDMKYITGYGWAIFTILMVFFMSRDLVISIKLLYSAAMSRSYRLFTGGATLLMLTTTAITASVFYNMAIAESDSQLVLNALLLAVYSSVDEEAMKLLITINPAWVRKKLLEANRYSNSNMFLSVNWRGGLSNNDINQVFTEEERESEDEERETNNCCVLNLFIDMIRSFM